MYIPTSRVLCEYSLFGLFSKIVPQFTKQLCEKLFSNMTEVFKLINPLKYLTDYLEQNVRPDGRTFEEQRAILMSVNSAKTADASSVVRVGDTAVVCGIKLELAPPKAEEPDVGFLITNVELPPLCSSKIRPGPPSDYAQVTSKIVYDLISNSKYVDLKDLCIVPDKLAWVVYCDMICINDDGSLVDACVISLLASLRTLSLPAVSYDLETEEIKVDVNERKQLEVHGLPAAVSFATIHHKERNIILSDPSAYEEEICGGNGSNLIICFNQGNLCGTQKFGSTNIPAECHEKAIKLAKIKAKVIEEAIETCINDYEKELTNSSVK